MISISRPHTITITLLLCFHASPNSIVTDTMTTDIPAYNSCSALLFPPSQKKGKLYYTLRSKFIMMWPSSFLEKKLHKLLGTSYQ